MKRFFFLLIPFALISAFVTAQTNQDEQEHLQIKGVFPRLTVMADGVGSTSETGIGALIPWANKLWAVGYVAHIKGSGIGLYEISPDLSVRLHPESVTGTFANRLVHWDSEQVIIGPHIIDPKGTVRTFKDLAKHRLTASAAYYVTTEGRSHDYLLIGASFSRLF